MTAKDRGFQAGAKSVCLRVSTATVIGLLGTSCLDASPSLLQRAKVVASAYDASQGRGTIYLMQHNVLKPIFSDNSVLSYPVISPSGDKIAFNRNPGYAVADGDIVVTDLSGRVLSSVLINKVTPGVNYARVQGIESIGWMGNDRIAVTGNANPAVSMGFIIYLRPSSLERPTSNGDNPHDFWFEDDGPSSISPNGTHIVSVAGLSQSYPYTSCAGDEQDAAKEHLQIDGIDVTPTDPNKVVVVAPFTWASETSFSTIIRYDKGLAILTAYDIPPEIKVAPAPPHAGVLRRGRRRAENPPKFVSTPLRLPAAEIPSAVFDGFYDAAGHYRVRQYVQGSPTVVANWTLSQGNVVRTGASDATPNPSDPRRASAIGRSISADMITFTARANISVSAISSENVWCKDIACGPLATAPAINAVPQPEGATSVPGICTEK